MVDAETRARVERLKGWLATPAAQRDPDELIDFIRLDLLTWRDDPSKLQLFQDDEAALWNELLGQIYDDQDLMTCAFEWQVARRQAQITNAKSTGGKTSDTKRKRAEAVDAESLTRRANWDALAAPHQSADGDGKKKAKASSRVAPGDMSKLGFPANSVPGIKYASFIKSISTIKTMKAGELKDKMAEKLPDLRWKNADDGVARMLDWVSNQCASTPTKHDGVVIDDKLPKGLWDILPSHLTEKQRAAYRVAFPGRWPAEEKNDKEKNAEEDEEEEAFDPFGFMIPN